MIVVDSNIIAYFLLPGEYTEAVERLYKQDAEWIAPRLWEDELINILATYERAGKLDAEEVTAVMRDAVELMEGNGYDVPPLRTLAMARRTGCSGYDAQFLALAEELGTQLYTFDRKLIGKSEGLAVEPKGV